MRRRDFGYFGNRILKIELPGKKERGPKKRFEDVMRAKLRWFGHVRRRDAGYIRWTAQVRRLGDKVKES